MQNTSQGSQSNCCQSDRFTPLEPEYARGENPLERLARMLPVEVLTQRALQELPPVSTKGVTAACEELQKVLYSRSLRHAVITGEEGVGKTTIVRELARRTAACEVPFLNGKTVLRIDVCNVGPEDSRGCLETIFTALSTSDLIVCLDGMAHLLRRQQGGSNKPLMRAMLARSGLSVIGILSRSDYQDLIASDRAMHDLFSRIDVEEPAETECLEIARQRAGLLQSHFGLQIPDQVVERTVTLTSHYCLSSRQPAKSTRLLTRLCEAVDYDRTQQGHPVEVLTPSQVVEGISNQTGIPAETIAGEDRPVGFEEALGATVVGQPEAVTQTALELRLIKAGLSEPGKAGHRHALRRSDRRRQDRARQTDRRPLLNLGSADDLCDGKLHRTPQCVGHHRCPTRLCGT